MRKKILCISRNANTISAMNSIIHQFLERETISLNELRERKNNGELLSFTAVGIKEGFMLQANLDNVTPRLRTSNSNIRIFKTLSACALYIKEKLDATELLVKFNDWDGEGVRRPYKNKQMKLFEQQKSA